MFLFPIWLSNVSLPYLFLAFIRRFFVWLQVKSEINCQVLNLVKFTRYLLCFKRVDISVNNFVGNVHFLLTRSLLCKLRKSKSCSTGLGGSYPFNKTSTEGGKVILNVDKIEMQTSIVHLLRHKTHKAGNI